MFTFSAEVDILPSCFNSHTIKKHLFCHLLRAMFFTFLMLSWWVISLINLASGFCAEVLCSVPKHKKVVMLLMVKICVLDKLCSVMSYTLGRELDFNESTVYIK